MGYDIPADHHSSPSQAEGSAGPEAQETIGQISFGGDMKPLPAELQIFRAEIYAKQPHKEVCRRFMLLGDFVYHSVQDEKARLRILRHLAVGFRLMIEEVPTP